MKKNKGFSLIESLIVIAIVGILLSVILSATKRTRDATLSDEEYCRKYYSNTSITLLPARCIHIFNTE